ncbi:hypothetical protein J4468_01840 [Candidatus Woesearchaeota archaeon]|nr:hypothetical protein [Candidatus Woesearchaeota archaeon]
MRKFLSQIKYPKLILLGITFVIAYLIFSGRDFLPFQNFLIISGYFGLFLLGIFFTYGFTAAPATAILLIISGQYNLLLAGFISGFGALVGDLIIFKFIRFSFSDEIERLSKEKAIYRIDKKIPHLLKRYLIPVLAGFIIASPLPDEIGVSLFAISHSISTRLFVLLSFTLNTAGILVVLLIGRLI